MRIRAYAARKPGGRLTRFDYDPGRLRPEQVEIEVLSCGLCYSDLSMLRNDWGITSYPFVPGHEVVGRVSRSGARVRHIAVGDTVGLGWVAGSCMACDECLSGAAHLCDRAEQTVVERHGGFANKLRCNAEWAIRLPPGLDPSTAGPLFCGGITVFSPIVELGVRPTDRVGVVGIGGLGHLALQFLRKWGCEVTAFTSSDSKRDEALALGAHHVVGSRDTAGLKRLAGSLDFVLVTVNAALPWERYLAALAPKGRFHVVGAVSTAIPVPAFALVGGQKSVSGSPVGPPVTMRRMLEFCLRHGIEPVTEHFPMSRANEALAHLAAGRARYRVVLDNDWRPSRKAAATPVA